MITHEIAKNTIRGISTIKKECIVEIQSSPLVRRDDRIRIPIIYPFWFSPQEVWDFKREHVLFVIAYSDMLIDGRYPPEHKDKACVDRGISSAFEMSVDLLTEVCRRLDRCGVKEGTAGDLLWHDVVEQFNNGCLAVEPDLHNIHGYFKLRPSAVLALDYCCGKDAKDENFYHWKNRKKGPNYF
jgi:hypothetical protein